MDAGGANNSTDSVSHTSQLSFVRAEAMDRSSRWSLLAVGVAASLCLAWTLALVVLSVAPNAAVNYLMDTWVLDEGSFWRFVDPPVAILVAGIAGLGSIALAYLYIIARVTVIRPRKTVELVPGVISQPGGPTALVARGVSKVAVVPRSNRVDALDSKLAIAVAAAKTWEVANEDSTTRKRMVRRSH